MQAAILCQSSSCKHLQGMQHALLAAQPRHREAHCPLHQLLAPPPRPANQNARQEQALSPDIHPFQTEVFVVPPLRTPPAPLFCPLPSTPAPATASYSAPLSYQVNLLDPYMPLLPHPLPQVAPSTYSIPAHGCPSPCSPLPPSLASFGAHSHPPEPRPLLAASSVRLKIATTLHLLLQTCPRLGLQEGSARHTVGARLTLQEEKAGMERERRP